MKVIQIVLDSDKNKKDDMVKNFQLLWRFLEFGKLILCYTVLLGFKSPTFSLRNIHTP